MTKWAISGGLVCFAFLVGIQCITLKVAMDARREAEQARRSASGNGDTQMSVLGPDDRLALRIMARNIAFAVDAVAPGKRAAARSCENMGCFGEAVYDREMYTGDVSNDADLKILAAPDPH